MNPFKFIEETVKAYYYRYGQKLFIVSIGFAIGCLILHSIVNLAVNVPEKIRTVMVISYVLLGIIFVPMILSVL